jgi:hypothetical protein
LPRSGIVARKKRTIQDSFPPLDYLDREALRETFILLGAKKAKAEGAKSPDAKPAGRLGESVTGAPVARR